MDNGSSSNTPSEHDQASAPDDGFLVASAAGGDSAALRKLMDRYDRLVRYTVYRVAKSQCVKDPDWLESVASDTWTGFVRSIRRESGSRPRSAKAYLARIARNQTISALRRIGAALAGASGNDASDPAVRSLDDGETSLEIPSTLEDPAETVSKLELLEALRGCLGELEADARALASQLPAITERRWRDAAEVLGLKESTLRSRWKQILGRLEGCVKRKTGEDFAPVSDNRDS